ncbi:MAG: hypothetical protein JSU73_05505 [candidate division WOR-3 bacterium]|nr:MAG: hypothetical protein JSU73_05505 [candidate division WOR-3 bacterium]
MKISGSGFGWIETDSGRYDHDIVVFPDGRVANRYDLLKGDNHLFGPEEARAVLEGAEADIVLGTGQYGLLRVHSDTAELLKGMNNVRLHSAPTPRAIEIYNSLAGPKCAVFHVTC